MMNFDTLTVPPPHTDHSLMHNTTNERFYPHHGARHDTVEMVNASDEDGSSLSFNSDDSLPRGNLPWAWR
jgi:hypothetical protein